MKTIDLDQLDALWEQQARLGFLLKAVVALQSDAFLVNEEEKALLVEQGIFWLMLEFEALQAQIEAL